MEPLYDTASLRALEQRASAVAGDDFALMQRAGAAAWRLLLARWPQAQRLVVACGPGNNGGDGYLLAAHAGRSGRTVQVRQVGAPRTDTARRALAECNAAGCAIAAFDGGMPRGDLLVDALFGIGLARAPEGEAAVAIEAMRAFDGPVFALDVPSGADADSGRVPGHAVRATLTLQMLGAHRGLATGDALDHVGECRVATLDVAAGTVQPAASALHAGDLARWLQPRPRNSHKGLYGHVLCIGGDHGSGGAILACAEAALRCGAGLVSVASRAEHVAPLLARRPEAMPHVVDDAHTLAPLLRRASVVAIGPGLGQGKWGRAMLAAALAAGKPLVLDADALNLLADAPRALPADAILTPHPGEAARLLGCDARDVQQDRFAAAATLVERHGCTIVLKGAGTIVAAPQARPRVVTAGNPGMATGGMGDLLTGVAAALRAQGLCAFDAASCAALLHGAAGDAAARELGERGLLASDLLPALHRLANPDPAA
ncbi:MAG TPA: NAD(P)H-hydrate dehydratase [Xanthomonadaceae bacterium]|nr:NAD(P)H-hydrate dehydratase [Xanthomonadaceae bacterium]